MKRLSTILSLFLLFGSAALAQYRDAGAWTSFSTEYKLRKTTELAISPEIRFYDNYSRISNAFVDFGVQEKVNNFLQFSITYRAGYRDPLEVEIWRQRIQTGFALKYELSDWTFGLNSRFQWGFVAVDDNDPDFITTLRNKASVKYAGFKKWELTGTFEVFHAQGQTSMLNWTDWRSTVQAEYKFTKRKFLSIGYLMQRNLISRVPEEDYVLLLSYKYMLKKKKSKNEGEDLEKE